MDQAAPAYPIVVKVKLVAMTAPNGLFGCWRSVGLIASAMKPMGFMNDPAHMPKATSGDGDTRNVTAHGRPSSSPNLPLVSHRPSGALTAG